MLEKIADWEGDNCEKCQNTTQTPLSDQEELGARVGLVLMPRMLVLKTGFHVITTCLLKHLFGFVFLQLVLF